MAFPPSSRDGFEIAIVCALPHELDAVDLLVDKYEDSGGEKYGKVGGDPNVYSYGRIAGFDVVLVLLPSMGKVNAAGAAAWLQCSFTNKQLAISGHSRTLHKSEINSLCKG
ncbi:hypothetical protein ACJ41O_007614 [Fusarium nematophilum]